MKAELLSKSGAFAFRMSLVLFILTSLSCLTVTTKSKTTREAASQKFKQNPEALTEIPLQSSEIEFAELIAPNRLLLQCSRISGSKQNWGVFSHELVLTDPVDGTVRWRMPNDVLQSSVDEVFYDDKTLYISSKDYEENLQRLTALSIEDGSILWYRRDPRYCCYFIIREKQTIIAAGGDRNGFTINALSAENGTPLWKMDRKPSFALDSHPSCGFTQDGENCLIFGNFLLNISLDDGSLNWEKKISGDNTTLSKAYSTEYGVLLAQKNGYTLLDRETGYKLSYDATVDAERLTDTLTGDSVLTIYQLPDGLQLRSIELPTGKLNWKRSLEEFPRSPIVRNGEEILISSKRTLSSFSVSDGALTGSRPIPTFLHTETGLTDRIIRWDDKIILAREEGIVAFSGDNTEVLYARYIAGTEMYSYSVASHRYLLRQVARSGQGQNFNQQGLTRELQNQLIRLQQSSSEAAANVSGMASLSVMDAAVIKACKICRIVSEGIAFQDEGAALNMSINRREINAAVNCHALCLQEGYYIRPFYRDGWGVTLIRLNDGARSDLKVSPDIEAFIINSGTFPLYLLRGDTLIVNGFGSSRSEDDTFYKVAYGKDVFGSWPGTPTNWHLPYSSLFTYSLEGMHFDLRLESLPPRPPLPDKKEYELRKFILQRDRESVKKVLNEGADPNVLDQLGWNALFYSAIVDDRKIAQLLVDKGADATARDYHQFLAYHYNVLTHGISQATIEFRSANIKQMKQQEE